MRAEACLSLYPQVDAIWVHKPENVQYLSGFTGDDSELLIFNNHFYFITDARYVEQAALECKGWQVLNHRGKLFALFRDLCSKHQARNIGLEPAAISLQLYRNLREKLPQIEVKSVNLDPLRAIKDANEINCIRKACQIASNALKQIIPLIVVGKSENEVRIELEKAMLDYGSEKVSFPTIVASGIRSALPHGVATDKIIEKGDFLTIDFGAVYKGYHSDITRTFIVGKPTAKQISLYNAVLEAQEKSVCRLKDGIRASDVDSFSREILKKYGLAEYFTHSLGHSVGREIHEGPNLSPRDPTVLKTGMVITVEPGIYISGYGGLRIEDSVLVREDEPEILTTFPKNLYEI